MQNDTATLENTLGFFLKTKHKLTIWPSNPSPSTHTWEIKTFVYIKIYAVMLIAALFIFLNIQFLFFMCLFFHNLFHFGLLWDMEYSSLCYTVGPCCLPILYIHVCLCYPLPSPMATTSMFSVSESVSVLFTGLLVPYFRFQI